MHVGSHYNLVPTFCRLDPFQITCHAPASRWPQRLPIKTCTTHHYAPPGNTGHYSILHSVEACLSVRSGNFTRSNNKYRSTCLVEVHEGPRTRLQLAYLSSFSGLMSCRVSLSCASDGLKFTCECTATCKRCVCPSIVRASLLAKPQAFHVNNAHQTALTTPFHPNVVHHTSTCRVDHNVCRVP
jgi:hypothetical protein